MPMQVRFLNQSRLQVRVVASPSALLAGAALTRVNDTNVTAVLGGSPTTALLRATSITLGWTGTLAVPRGGTGTSTFASGAVLVGAGSGTIATVAPFGNSVLWWSGSGVPAASVAPVLGNAGSSGGAITLAGSTSGSVTIQTVAAAGVYNFNLPTSAGSSGQPLLSGGGASAQTYGTLTVQFGGTGTGTWATNTLIIGGATATGTFQQVAGGTSGTVLTSQGAGVVPIWTAGGGSTGSFSPSPLLDVDDTNVTIAWSGASTTAVSGTTTLTAGWTGTLAVARGGLGTGTWAGTNSIVASGITGTGTIQIVANSATTGTVMRSNGAAALPSFGVALVPGGGIGTSTWAGTNSLVASGINATGTIQVVAASATTGTILRSGGTAGVPTWSTATYPATVTANAILYGSGTNVVGEIASFGNTVPWFNGSGVPTASTTPLLGNNGGATGTIALAGSTSGSVTIRPAAAAGTYNFNLPTSSGSSGQPLLSGGGANAVQTYGTLAVPAGGSGSTTWTPFAVFAGGTNATATLQQVSGLGATGTVLTSNGAGALPTWQAGGGAVAVPTVQRFTSGSGTYTTAANARWLRIRMVGGGGGGCGSGQSASAGAGGNAGSSTFDGTTYNARGGTGGPVPTSGFGASGGAGGAASGGTIANFSGAAGGASPGTNAIGASGGAGGATPFAGGGAAGISGGGAGVAGVTNSGAGGGGAGNSTGFANWDPGGGGGAGGYVETVITSPSASYTYVVGAGGTAGTAGTNGNVGGAGAAGIIIVEEYY